MTQPRWIKWIAILGGFVLIAGSLTLLRKTSLAEPITWQRQASPGRLSAAHAALENNCAACHTAIQGPEAAKCIACHATDQSLLLREPTAFHAEIASCRECHREHQGINQRPTHMDHVALARLGLKQLYDAPPDSEMNAAGARLASWIREAEARHLATPHSRIAPEEAILHCATCHANEDRHNAHFGRDCAQCHATSRWTIAEFRHPSPRSLDCAQCHRAPPSHYMEHFHMVSMRVAGKPHAHVEQCYLCHQTTAWNDIQGVGWYKHH